MSELSNSPEIACSLGGAQIRDRRKFVRASLVPYILRSLKLPTGLELVFENTASLRSDVELFVELEGSCCGFLSFTISTCKEELVLRIEGPAEAEEILAKFSQGLVLS